MLPVYKPCQNSYTIKTGATLRLQSTGYPNGYEMYTFCTYLVEGPEGTRASLVFYDFDLEDFYDYLEVGNGNNPGDRDSVIGRFDGSMMPTNLQAEGSSLWLFFYADYAVSGSGFSVGISANDPGRYINNFN